MNWERFISDRFYKSSNYQGKYLGILSMIGMGVGCFAMLVSISVMNGFERELRERILEVIPHATIEGPFDTKTSNQIRDILASNSKIKGSAPFIETQALISSSEALKGVVLKGVSSELEIEVSKIEQHMILGDWFSLEQDKFNVIIGNVLALQLGVGLKF